MVQANKNQQRDSRGLKHEDFAELFHMDYKCLAITHILFEHCSQLSDENISMMQELFDNSLSAEETPTLLDNLTKMGVLRRAPTQARSVSRVLAILETATDLCVEVGPENLSTALIAQRVGVTYWHRVPVFRKRRRHHQRSCGSY